jgi:hypothetical protein
MLDKFTSGVVTIVITVVATSMASLIAFYAGLLYQASVPISAQANIIILPNPIVSKYSIENPTPKALNDLLKMLPPSTQGGALIQNTFQVAQLDITNNGDSRSDKLELMVPDNTGTAYYIGQNKPTIATGSLLNLGTINPGETMHVSTIGTFLYNEQQVSLLLNGRRVSLEGPINRERLGVVPYLAIKFPAVFSLMLFICTAVLGVSLGEVIQGWRFRTDVSYWAKTVSVEKLQGYRGLVEYVEANDPDKFSSAKPKVRN